MTKDDYDFLKAMDNIIRTKDEFTYRTHTYGLGYGTFLIKRIDEILVQLAKEYRLDSAEFKISVTDDFKLNILPMNKSAEALFTKYDNLIFERDLSRE